MTRLRRELGASTAEGLVASLARSLNLDRSLNTAECRRALG